MSCWRNVRNCIRFFRGGRKKAMSPERPLLRWGLVTYSRWISSYVFLNVVSEFGSLCQNLPGLWTSSSKHRVFSFQIRADSIVNMYAISGIKCVCQSRNELSLSKVSLEHKTWKACRFWRLGMLPVTFEVKLLHRQRSFYFASMEIKHWGKPQAGVPMHANEFSVDHGRIRI